MPFQDYAGAVMWRNRNGLGERAACVAGVSWTEVSDAVDSEYIPLCSN